MEIQSMTSKDDYGLFIRNYKTGIEQYRKRIAKLRDTINNNKNLDSLLISNTETQREKLIDNDMAYSQLDRLESAKRATIEMEHVSVTICKDLNQQTETMKGVQTKLGSLNREIQGSNSLISRMMRREHRNKAIIVIFSIGLVMTFLVIVYFKLFPSPGN
jgi:hypothetical protein